MQRRELLKTLAAVGSTAVVSQAAATTSTSKRAGDPIERDAVKFWSESSLNRVFPNSEPGSACPLELVTARNAQLSFQACFRNLKASCIRVCATVEASAGWSVQVRRVGYVPMQQLNTDVPLDEVDGVGHVPGLVPDPLYPEETANIGPECNGAFWITLRFPADAEVGVREIIATLTVEDEFRFPMWMSAKPFSVKLPIAVDTIRHD